MTKKKPIRRPRPAKRAPVARTVVPAGPVTLKEARALARPAAALRAGRRAAPVVPVATVAAVGAARKTAAAARQREARRRVKDYKATMAIMKRRGARAPRSGPSSGRKKAPGPAAPAIAAPLQIFAEGDSWFDYPVPFFGGGVIPRLEDLIGVPILNLAKAGDEVRFMLGVKERKELIQQFTNGCPAGGPWDVLLFSGGGNDIVDNPMCLWVKQFDATIPLLNHILQARFDTALAMVRFGYEDLIALRDQLSPTTHLVFHAYDFALPDGRGICNLGPWLKPTFDLRHFPSLPARAAVVKAMLEQFALMLQAVASAHAGVSVINGQGLLTPQPSSWHNELHPSKQGFGKFAALFRQTLKAVFPTRVF